MMLSHLEFLVAVKEYGSMNKAAGALFCSQPTISNAFKSIEKELDCKIIERTTSGVSFTPFGERVVADSKLILNIINKWKMSKGNHQTAMDVAFSNNSVSTMLDMIFSFQSENPDIKLNLISTSNRGVAILSNDSGVYYRFGFFQHTPMELAETKREAAKIGMKIAKIANGSFTVCMNANNPLAEKDMLSMSDIGGKRVALKEGPVKFPYKSHLLNVNCDCSLALGNHENVMLAIVNDPELIGLRPDTSLVHDYYVSRGLICTKHIKDASLELNQYVFFPEQSRMDVYERSFIEHIKNNAQTFETV